MQQELEDQAAEDCLNQLQRRAQAIQKERQLRQNQLIQSLATFQEQRQDHLNRMERALQVAAGDLQHSQGILQTTLSTLSSLANDEHTQQQALVFHVKQLEQEAKRL